MASFVKRTLQFLAITLALYVAALFALSHIKERGRAVVFRTGDYYHWPGGDTWQRFREYDPKVRQDVVIIGSSHAYRGYDPRVFTGRGLSAFNLGSSGQTPLNTLYLIEAFLDSSNTSLLVFDIYEGVLAADGLESTSDLVQNQPNTKAAVGMTWSLQDLRGLNLITQRLVGDQGTPYYTSDEYLGLGFAPSQDSVKLPTKGTSAPVAFDPRQQAFFAQCLDLCQRKGIRTVVASHYARYNMQGSYHAPTRRFIDSTLAGRGIPYLDFTEVPGIDERNWFADHNHLNATGARIFTEQLADTLEALGCVQRRGIRQD